MRFPAALAIIYIQLLVLSRVTITGLSEQPIIQI